MYVRMYIHTYVCIYVCVYVRTWCALLPIAVDDSYSGPRLDGEMTMEFMQEMMDTFREQKLIHKKYTFKVCIMFISMCLCTYIRMYVM